MIPYTKNTITDLEKFARVLNKIRSDGFAFDNQEESEGIYAIAVPVYNSRSEVIAAISVPFFGDYKVKREKYLPLLYNCAGEISKSMGYIKEK